LQIIFFLFLTEKNPVNSNDSTILFPFTICLFLIFQGEIEVKAIVLDQKEDGFSFNTLSAEDLSKMQRLKLLILYHKNFSGNPISLSNSLCYFLWDGYPFTSLPLDFQPSDLVELNMPNSRVETLWTGIQVLYSFFHIYSM
jgi:hypothetical protein